MMDAIVTAGGIPEPGDLLYPYTQGKPKAMLDICGKPMIQWVLDALDQTETVDKVVVVGLPDDQGLACAKAKAFIPNQGGIIENIRAAVEKVIELNPTARQVLAVSSDVPAVTAEGLNWVVNTTSQTDDDVYYNVIERRVMETRFPGSRRSYTRLRDVEVCGGDVNVIRTTMIRENDELWQRIVASRKNVFKQAALIGYGTLLLLLLRSITLNDAVSRVAKRMKVTGRALLCPYAELGMDVDKPHQLELLRADLSRRATL